MSKSSKQLKDLIAFNNALSLAFKEGIHRDIEPSAEVRPGDSGLNDRVEAFLGYVVGRSDLVHQDRFHGDVSYLADGSAITYHTVEGTVTFLVPAWLQSYFKTGF